MNSAIEEIEFVDSPAALEGTFAWNPERVAEAACETCTVYVHDALTDGGRCGPGIVDDPAGICCHDPDTGALVASIDTDAPEAREWALSTFGRLRPEANPADPREVAAPDSPDSPGTRRPATLDESSTGGGSE